MGCVVNGPGEAREADIGIAGGKGEAVLFIHGKPIKKLTGDNKELMIIPGANHVDLYDSPTAIPFEKLKSFFVGIS